MADKIDIINMALRRISEQPINALDEGSESANVISDIYDISLEYEIRSFPYTWAQKTQELARIDEEAPPDYASAFQLPSDYLKIVEILTPAKVYEIAVSSDDYRLSTNNMQWEIREGKLYYNSDTITIKYLALETNTVKWDSSFVDAFAWRLASEAAPSITDNNRLIDRADRMYAMKIDMARSSNGSESRRMPRISHDYLKARY